MNAAASRRVAKHTRLGVDVFNVFNRRAAPLDYLDMPPGATLPSDEYLFHPAEPRGFRLRLRITF